MGQEVTSLAVVAVMIVWLYGAVRRLNDPLPPGEKPGNAVEKAAARLVDAIADWIRDGKDGRRAVPFVIAMVVVAAIAALVAFPAVPDSRVVPILIVTVPALLVILALYLLHQMARGHTQGDVAGSESDEEGGSDS